MNFRYDTAAERSEVTVLARLQSFGLPHHTTRGHYRSHHMQLLEAVVRHPQQIQIQQYKCFCTITF